MEVDNDLTKGIEDCLNKINERGRAFFLCWSDILCAPEHCSIRTAITFSQVAPLPIYLRRDHYLYWDNIFFVVT